MSKRDCKKIKVRKYKIEPEIKNTINEILKKKLEKNQQQIRQQKGIEKQSERVIKIIQDEQNKGNEFKKLRLV